MCMSESLEHTHKGMHNEDTNPYSVILNAYCITINILGTFHYESRELSNFVKYIILPTYIGNYDSS